MDTTKPAWIVLWAFMALTFGITLLPNYGFSRAVQIFGHNFSGVVDVENKYPITITPADWTFFIWNIVYVWQIIWMIYTGTLILRSTGGSGESGHLYYSPPSINSQMFIAYMISSLSNFIWNIFWCLENIDFALCFVVLLAAMLYIAFAICVNALHKHGQELINTGHWKDVLFNMIFVQWGIGIYTSWVTISILLNFTTVLQHYAHISAETSAAISLATLLVLMAILFAVDNFIFEKQCRYFFIPYCVVIYFLIGSLQKNWTGNINSVFTLCILIFVCALTMVKMVLVMRRRRHEPLFVWEVVDGEHENQRLLQEHF